MTSLLETAIRKRLLAVAEERELPITTGDVVAITNAVLAATLAPGLVAGPATLTGQQTGVLVGLALGDSADATAGRMCVSVNTVKTHRRALYKALGAHSGPQAVAIAMSLGLLRPQHHFSLPGQRDGRAS